MTCHRQGSTQGKKYCALSLLSTVQHKKCAVGWLVGWLGNTGCRPDDGTRTSVSKRERSTRAQASLFGTEVRYRRRNCFVLVVLNGVKSLYCSRISFVNMGFQIKRSLQHRQKGTMPASKKMSHTGTSNKGGDCNTQRCAAPFHQLNLR